MRSHQQRLTCLGRVGRWNLYSLRLGAVGVWHFHASFHIGRLDFGYYRSHTQKALSIGMLHLYAFRGDH